MINVIRMLTVDEGLKTKVYKDTMGNRTVGIGFNMDDPHARGVWIFADVPESFTSVYNGISQISTQTAWNLASVQIDNCMKDIKRLLPDFDDHPDYVRFSLINLMFNLGYPKFSKFVQFLDLIKNKAYKDASDDLSRTAWAIQLPNRCKRVRALLMGDDSLYAQG